MKRLIIAIIIIAGFSKAEAQSMLRVHLADNSQVNVSLDGRYFNKRGTGVTVGDLPPGRHYLQIYAVSPNRRGRGQEDVIYEGKVKTVNGMITLFEYDPSTNATNIQQQDINVYTNSQPQLNAQIQAHQNNNGNNDNGNGNGYAGNDNMNNGAYAMPAAPVKTGTLTDVKIDQLKTQVAAKNTDTEKMNVLKDGLKDEKITTGQLAAMMDWFGFESTKVDFAEWAYSNTVDKEYFTDLENKFTYKEYQDALDKFIKSK